MHPLAACHHVGWSRACLAAEWPRGTFVSNASSMYRSVDEGRCDLHGSVGIASVSGVEQALAKGLRAQKSWQRDGQSGTDRRTDGACLSPCRLQTIYIHLILTTSF